MDILTASTLPVPDTSYPFGDDLAEFLDPPVSPGPLLKLSALPTEDGYTSAVYPPFPFDQDGVYDWMSSDSLLPTPEEQENSLLSFIQPPVEPSPSFSLPTPDSSSPPTPLSSYSQDPEFLDALSLISGSPAAPSGHGHPSHIFPQFDSHSPLPSPASYNTSSAYSFSMSPCEPTQSTFLPSPLSLTSSPLESSYLSASSLPSSPFSPEIIDLTKTEGGIKELLCQGNTKEDCLITSTSPHERKRSDADDSPAASEPKGKRRKLTKTAKKERKREQNKQAALRYRKRKHGEAEEVEDKREELEALNSDLKRQVKALSTEISYLKNLWMEVAAVREQRSAADSP